MVHVQSEEGGYPLSENLIGELEIEVVKEGTIDRFYNYFGLKQ